MAKLTGINTKLSGQVGEYVFTQTKHGTVVYEAPTKKSEPRRSYLQMSTRTQWSNLGATYKLFDDMLKHGFEEVPMNQTSYNAFVAANLGKVKVYITKDMRKKGACILAPYDITEGSLSGIGLGLNGSGVVVSRLSLGNLVIDANTTLAEFSEAVLANNQRWEEGDQLSFFYGEQYTDEVTGYPRATLESYKMKLDTANPTPLWNVVSALGFSSVDGYLGMSQALTNGAAVWVHSRVAFDGRLLVSTQKFFVVNPILTSYQSLNALKASTDSYGGINTKEVYLKPNADTNSVAGSASGSGSTSGTGTGSGTGGSGSGTGGGSQTPTVATQAPVISGTTPFAESTQVTITGPADARVYYTVNGTTPTAESTLYTEAFTLSDTTTVKAIAIKEGVSSSVTTKVFTKGSGSGDDPTGGEE